MIKNILVLWFCFLASECNASPKQAGHPSGCRSGHFGPFRQDRGARQGARCARYEVVIASDPRYAELEAPLGCAFHSIQSIPAAEFAQALALVKPLHDIETLTRYVEDDRALINQVKPHCRRLPLAVGGQRIPCGGSLRRRGQSLLEPLCRHRLSCPRFAHAPAWW